MKILPATYTIIERDFSLSDEAEAVKKRMDNPQDLEDGLLAVARDKMLKDMQENLEKALWVNVFGEPTPQAERCLTYGALLGKPDACH